MVQALCEFPAAGKVSCWSLVFAEGADVQLTFSDLVSAQGLFCCEGWEEESEAGRWARVLYSTYSVLPDTDEEGLSPCLCQHGKGV